MKKLTTFSFYIAIIGLTIGLLSCNKKITKAPTLPTISYSYSGNLKNAPCLITFTNNSKDATSYSWNFGDGNAASTEINPTHTYISGGTYIVTLTATGSNGNSFRSDTISIKGTPKQPIAGFTFISDGKPAPSLVTFSDSSKNASSYSWDFGDGSPVSTDKNPTHIYSNSGIYTVTLVATNLDGSNSKSTIINIKAIELPNNPIVLSFTYVGNPLTAPCKVTFKNTSQNASSYKWDFGDNTSSTEVSPTHTFKTAGKYTVTLNETTADAVKSFTETITIVAPTKPDNPPVNAISFSKGIQPILTSSCTSCHNGKKHPLNLTAGSSFASLSARTCINKANPSISKFYTKINAGGSMAKHTNSQFAAKVLQWIKEGAKNN